MRRCVATHHRTLPVRKLTLQSRDGARPEDGARTQAASQSEARDAEARPGAQPRVPRSTFPSVDMIDEVLVFGLGHNRYRLINTVFFGTRELYVKALLTH